MFFLISAVPRADGKPANTAVTMTALRQKFIDELDLRGFSHNTKDNYVGAFDRLARHFGRSPDQRSDDELKQYLLHLIRDRQRSRNTMTVIVSAFRFFYGFVLHRSTTALDEKLPRMRPQTIRPRVYSSEEIERLLNAPGLNPKHRALLMTTYAAGLRVSEVCALKVAIKNV
jgi:integrase/recombinase XerD